MSESERAVTSCPVQRPALPAASVDLGACDLLEITAGLFEHERPPRRELGLRLETWPAEVQRLMSREVERFKERNPNRLVRAVTTAVTRDACVLLLHHVAK